jgi:hypothetical protein
MMRMTGVRSRQAGGNIGYLRVPLINEWTMQAF